MLMRRILVKLANVLVEPVCKDVEHKSRFIYIWIGGCCSTIDRIKKKSCWNVKEKQMTQKQDNN